MWPRAGAAVSEELPPVFRGRDRKVALNEAEQNAAEDGQSEYKSFSRSVLGQQSADYKREGNLGAKLAWRTDAIPIEIVRVRR